MQINICTSRNFGIQITYYNDSKFEYKYECPKLVYKQPIIIYCLDTWSGAFNSNIRDAVSESYMYDAVMHSIAVELTLYLTPSMDAYIPELPPYRV